MASPFPGMDPYLEGDLWPDVHSALAHKIRQQLAPKIQPKYVARLEISVMEDRTFESEIGVMYPDVEVLRSLPGPPSYSSYWGEGGVMVAESVATLAPLTIRLPKVRLVSVEIRTVAHNELVTCIEILSPVNKREPNLTQYRKKRERLRQGEVHLLEIDLIRRGSRVWHSTQIPPVPYVIALTRDVAEFMEVWPLNLADPLPLVPVPLRIPDREVSLDLAAALKTVYEEAYYHLSIDYHQAPPPPVFAEKELAWLKELGVGS